MAGLQCKFMILIQVNMYVTYSCPPPINDKFEHIEEDIEVRRVFGLQAVVAAVVAVLVVPLILMKVFGLFSGCRGRRGRFRAAVVACFRAAVVAVVVFGLFSGCRGRRGRRGRRGLPLILMKVFGLPCFLILMKVFGLPWSPWPWSPWFSGCRGREACFRAVGRG
ncbi:hypothetical protein L9F63_010121, partial [Diploptera punctata]